MYAVLVISFSTQTFPNYPILILIKSPRSMTNDFLFHSLILPFYISFIWHLWGNLAPQKCYFLELYWEAAAGSPHAMEPGGRLGILLLTSVAVRPFFHLFFLISIVHLLLSLSSTPTPLFQTTKVDSLLLKFLTILVKNTHYFFYFLTTHDLCLIYECFLEFPITRLKLQSLPLSSAAVLITFSLQPFYDFHSTLPSTDSSMSSSVSSWPWSKFLL